MRNKPANSEVKDRNRSQNRRFSSKAAVYRPLMSRFRVCFDGRWQASFETLDDATDYARGASKSGTMTWVVQGRFLGLFPKLDAAFPEKQRDAVERAWHASKGVAGVGYS
jgi:hypothetical protein